MQIVLAMEQPRIGSIELLRSRSMTDSEGEQSKIGMAARAAPSLDARCTTKLIPFDINKRLSNATRTYITGLTCASEYHYLLHNVVAAYKRRDTRSARDSSPQRDPADEHTRETRYSRSQRQQWHRRRGQMGVVARIQEGQESLGLSRSTSEKRYADEETTKKEKEGR